MTLKRPSLDFDLWFLKFASISDMLFLLDFGFRIYLTVRLFFKYWDAGSIKLPEIDMRTCKEIRNPFKMSNGRLFILLFTNPLIGAFLMVLVGSWVVSFAASVYAPVYMEYVNGCVPQNGNGTFVTSNVYSMSYNFAYQQGSSSLVRGIKTFDKERSVACSSLYASSATKQNDDMLQISSFTKSIKSTNKYMGKLNKCIDVDLIDMQFESACCGKQGYGACDNFDINNNTDNNKSNNNNTQSNIATTDHLLEDDTKQYICPMQRSLEYPIPYSKPGKKSTIVNTLAQRNKWLLRPH